MSFTTGKGIDMASSPVKVGIIGCGNISGIYLKNLYHTFANVDLVACADLDPERAKAKAEATDDSGAQLYPDLKALSVDDLLADPDIDIVVNLTIPLAHHSVAMQALEAGKSVYNEKPLTVTRDEGKALLRIAEEKGLLVGSAPDTFLGAGIQTCRKLIDDGWIGTPVSATAFMYCPGHEHWHPDPEFYYDIGGGPMFDMGPYYLTALVSLLGPVGTVSGMTGKSRETRTILSSKKLGNSMEVKVPTHVAGLLGFTSGAIGTIITSFDAWGHHLPRIEIQGTEGALSVPDPNGFGGPVMVKRGYDKWGEVPLSHRYAENSRGIGPADMAQALTEKRKARAGGELAYHVLDLMHSIHDAWDQKSYITVESTCDRPDAMPMNPKPGQVV